MAWSRPISFGRSSHDILQQLAHYGMTGVHRSQAMVVGNRLLFCSTDGLTCLDLDTGDVIWNKSTSGDAWGSNDDAMLTATRLALGGGLYDQFACDDSTVYFLTEDDPIHSTNQGTIRRRNRIVACDIETGDVRWERADIRMADDRRSQVVSQFFLSAPVVDGPNLYVLGQESFQESDADVRLILLDSRTGDLVETIDVGFSPIPLQEDAHRQEFGGRIVLQGELVICATGWGSVSGVDPAARVVRWAHTFPRINLSPPPPPQYYYYGPMQASIGWEWWRGWRGVTLTAMGDYVVFASPETDRLIVYDYRSGRPVWDHPREFGRFVADVLPDRVLVAGAQGMEAFELTTGELLWRADTPPIVGGGFTAGGMHVAPLSDDRCVAIDVVSGQVLHQSRFESTVFAPAVIGSVVVHHPASLIRWNDTLLRITPEGVTRQQSLLQLSSMFQIGESPSEEEVLQQALLSEDLGRWDEADALLISLTEGVGATAERAEQERVALLMRRLARGFELSASQDAFLRQSQFGSEYVALLIHHRLEAIRAATEAQPDSPALLSPAEASAILNDIFTLQADSPEGDFFNVTNQQRVRLDRYLQGAILDVLGGVEESARGEIERQIATRFQNAINNAESTRERWHLIFRSDRLPWAQRFAVELTTVDGLISSERLLHENLLWELSESDDASIAALAILRLAEMPASRVDGIPTLLLERIERYLDLQLADGRTVRDAIHSSGADTIWPLALAHREQPAWPAVVPEVTAGRRRAGMQARRYVQVEPTFPAPLARVNIEVTPEGGVPQGIRFVGSAKSFWSDDLPSDMARLEADSLNPYMVAFEPAEQVRAWNVGPVVYLQSGAELAAFRPFDENGEPNASNAWSRLLRIRSTGDAAINNTETTVVQRPGVRDTGSEYSDSFGFRVDTFGPFLPNFFCMPETGDLVVRSSSSGRELWRTPIVAGSRWLANGDAVVVYREQDWVFHVHRSVDGELLATHQLPGRVIDSLDVSGCTLLLELPLENPGGEGVSRLSAWDACEGRIVWSRPLGVSSLPFVIDQQLIGVIERNTEQIELIDIATGDVVCTHLPDQPDDIQNIHCIVDADHVIVVVSRAIEEVEDAMFPGMNPNPRIFPMNGTLHAFDRHLGEWIWTRHVKDVDLNLDQPRHLPLLVLHDFSDEPEYDIFFGGMPTPVDTKIRFVVLDKRTGDLLVDETLETRSTTNAATQKVTVEHLTVLTDVDFENHTILLRTNAAQSFLFEYAPTE